MQQVFVFIYVDYCTFGLKNLCGGKCAVITNISKHDNSLGVTILKSDIKMRAQYANSTMELQRKLGSGIGLQALIVKRPSHLCHINTQQLHFLRSTSYPLYKLHQLLPDVTQCILEPAVGSACCLRGLLLEGPAA